jgi:isopenicillin-N epimerase
MADQVPTVPIMSPTERFGAHLRRDWMLDPAVTYLNHGTVGAPPRQVLEFQRSLIDQIERNPARFMLRELADWTGAGTPTRIRAAAAHVAGFVGCAADDLVFVDNITAGVNAVLRSFPFRHGDEIAVTTLGYGGITNAATYAARTAGAALRTIELPQPGAAPHRFVDAVANGLTPATRILVVDHLAARAALVLPVAEIVAACHAQGVLVLIDGAHVPGNIALDIEALGADWYTANLHKWAWAPRSCGLLWTSPAQQPHIRPVVTSWGFDHGLAAEFDLPGTRDPTPMLSAPFAIDLMREFDLEAIYRYNHDLAWWTGRHLAETWGTSFTAPESMIGAMVTVPLPAGLGDSEHDAERVRRSLEVAGIEAAVLVAPPGLAVRVSVQIYCDEADIERLGRAIVALQ